MEQNIGKGVISGFKNNPKRGGDATELPLIAPPSRTSTCQRMCLDVEGEKRGVKVVVTYNKIQRYIILILKKKICPLNT